MKSLRNPPRLKIPNFAVEPLFRRWFRSRETTHWHTSAISQPSTPISQLKNGLRNGYENVPPLRNLSPAVKLPICCENEKRPLASLLNVINSLFYILTGHLNFKKIPRGAKPEHPPVCRPLHLSKSRAPLPVFVETTMVRTRGAKSLSPLTRLRMPRDTCLRLHIHALRGHGSSHLRLRRHPSVLRPSVITQGAHSPWLE